MTADAQLKAFIDRVLRLKEEQDTLSADIREVYAEAKMSGYDKTVMGKLVAYLRKIEKAGPDAAEEAEAVFDTYLTAYQRASGTQIAIAHTHEEFDRETGEILHNETHERPSTNDKASPEAASADLPTNSADPRLQAASGGEPSIPSPDAGGVKMDGAPTPPGRSDEQSAYDDAKSGHAANLMAVARPQSKTARDYRPHCLKPDACGASGLSHCYSCKKASEAAA